MSHKRFLYLNYNALGLSFAVAAYERAGFCAVAYDFTYEDADCEDMNKKEEMAGALITELTAGKYDFLFSMNFFAVPALVCKTLGILYLSWTYDSPFLQAYSEAVLFDTNILFDFDADDTERLKKRGANAVYLPLAADTNEYEKVIKSAPSHIRKRYRSDAAFVGSLYSTGSQYGVFNDIERVKREDAYIGGFLEGLIKAQGLVYGADLLEKGLPLELAFRINEMTGIVADGRKEVVRWVIANAYMARKATQHERMAVAEVLSKITADSAIYTDSEITPKGRLRVMPPVSYYTQAPIVFANSRINLNITLRSIHEGIPLRAFDIMACKGFLMTNYQSGLFDLFEPEKDFVYYESIDHLKDLIEFYLKNDELITKISVNAYEKVKKYHNYDVRVRQMMEIADIGV